MVASLAAHADDQATRHRTSFRLRIWLRPSSAAAVAALYERPRSSEPSVVIELADARDRNVANALARGEHLLVAHVAQIVECDVIDDGHTRCTATRARDRHTLASSCHECHGRRVGAAIAAD